MDTDSHAPGTPISQEEELPKPADIEIELNDIYRHDEEQAFITLMSQEVKSLNFAAEANYTVRLCKEIVAYHYPDKMPLGSFELVASISATQDVIVALSKELVVTAMAEQSVIAASSIQNIIVVAAAKGVVIIPAKKNVIVFFPINDVITFAAN